MRSQISHATAFILDPTSVLMRSGSLRILGLDRACVSWSMRPQDPSLRFVCWDLTNGATDLPLQLSSESDSRGNQQGIKRESRFTRERIAERLRQNRERIESESRANPAYIKIEWRTNRERIESETRLNRERSDNESRTSASTLETVFMLNTEQCF
jgi:hypothetical protein